MWGDDPADYRRMAYNPVNMCVQVKLPDNVQLDCGCIVELQWEWQWGNAHPVSVSVVCWKVPEKGKPIPGSADVAPYQSFHPCQDGFSTEPKYHKHDGASLDAKIVYIRTELMRRYRTHVMGVRDNGPPAENPA